MPFYSRTTNHEHTFNEHANKYDDINLVDFYNKTSPDFLLVSCKYKRLSCRRDWKPVLTLYGRCKLSVQKSKVSIVLTLSNFLQPRQNFYTNWTTTFTETPPNSGDSQITTNGFGLQSNWLDLWLGSLHGWLLNFLFAKRRKRTWPNDFGDSKLENSSGFTSTATQTVKTWSTVLNMHKGRSAWLFQHLYQEKLSLWVFDQGHLCEMPLSTAILARKSDQNRPNMQV